VELHHIAARSRRTKVNVILWLSLSPGKHNQLEKMIVEVFAPIFIDGAPKVLLLSDAEHRLKYVDPLARKLGLKLDEHEKMPDVILYSPTRNIVYIVEAVTSGGPINDARIKDIEQTVLPTKLSFGVEYFTAFPDRSMFRKFLDEIAWGTQVWLASEPFGVVIFRRVR
jgi:type II restriction enzyme